MSTFRQIRDQVYDHVCSEYLNAINAQHFKNFRVIVYHSSSLFIMEQEQQGITVTRALAELKTLDKRIHKAVQDCDLVKVRRKEDKWDIQEYNRQAQGSYQSLEDLISRRDQLKRRVLASNAVTQVRIGKDVLTIAEVIDRKQSIEYKKRLLDKLRSQRQVAQSLYESRVEEVRRKLDNLLEVNFGKEGKSNPENVAAITKTYHDTHKVEIVDPLNVGMKIKSLEEEITEFDKEADLVLSESNARTYIPV